MRRRPLPSSVLSSTSTTPVSSAFPSACPTEDEAETEIVVNKPTFPFLSLPSELRNKIYGLIFSSATTEVIDLDPQTFRLFHKFKVLAVFLVSHQVYHESTRYFFSTHTFRLFPVHPGRFFKTKRPLLTRLPSQYRSSITSLELRLGPGWNNPPRSWAVTKDLGLKDCTQVRMLKIFVECDPSDVVFKGFRRGEGFYENFCKKLLEDILKELPGIQIIQLDAWSSVKMDGAMMLTLEEVANNHQKVIAWVGKESTWPLLSPVDEIPPVIPLVTSLPQ